MAQDLTMTPEMGRDDAQAAGLAGLVVECVVFDQADRPKRRHLLPLAMLLQPLSGGISGLAADAR